MTTKETILRLLEVDSVKECDGNVFEALAEMRYRYELERKAIKAYSSFPGYNGDDVVESMPTKQLEEIVERHEELTGKEIDIEE